MKRFQTIFDLLSHADPKAIAITAPSALPLQYGELVEMVDRSIKQLNELGIGRGDRVALSMPNGPLNATAFLAVACSATAAPLNPAYRAEEIEFYLRDLNARALVVEAGSGDLAKDVARRLGIEILVATPDESGRAGTFSFKSEQVTAGHCATRVGTATAQDLALILHTSGTTSRPKIVPLTHANICESACNVRDTLSLSVEDRGLNIMPLFHIHGLIAGLLAPMAGGGSVCCTPGFNALKFFSWMKEAKPTWYTAVPTMHQAILGRSANNADIVRANPLRFIRSSSSSIPPQVIRELEAAFGAPLIESYGMTEASHQMASNPLPPKQRKPGTVGVAAGPNVAVRDAAGVIHSRSGVGEIVIQGPNVTSGYENNDAANAEAFVEGWFRTGDLGEIDAHGYLSITGRIKEIINRGGEKISPREIDEILMDHPAVAQVVTFGIPHAKLGEVVGVVAVLREGQSVTEQELRVFVGQRVADFKIPAKILFKDEIPKGATGKLQRIGLAEKLGLVLP